MVECECVYVCICVYGMRLFYGISSTGVRVYKCVCVSVCDGKFRINFIVVYI